MPQGRPCYQLLISSFPTGKVMIEDDVKEEIKEEMESHAGPEEGELGKPWSHL